MKVLAIFLALSSAGAAPPGREARVVDRIVAIVEGQAITASELDFEARVMLIERGGSEAATAPLDEVTLRAALDAAIAQRLQTAEADKLQTVPLDDQALRERMAQFEERLGGRRALKSFLAAQDADESQLAEVLGRALRAEKFLDSKIHLRAQVSEVEVQHEYERHPELYGPSFQAAHDAIRERLRRERYGQLAEGELNTLRATASVRLLGPFAKGGP